MSPETSSPRGKLRRAVFEILQSEGVRMIAWLPGDRTPFSDEDLLAFLPGDAGDLLDHLPGRLSALGTPLATCTYRWPGQHVIVLLAADPPERAIKLDVTLLNRLEPHAELGRFEVLSDEDGRLGDAIAASRQLGFDLTPGRLEEELARFFGLSFTLLRMIERAQHEWFVFDGLFRLVQGPVLWITQVAAGVTRAPLQRMLYPETVLPADLLARLREIPLGFDREMQLATHLALLELVSMTARTACIRLEVLYPESLERAVRRELDRVLAGV